MVLRPANWRSEMHTIKAFVAIAALLLAPALVNAQPSAAAPVSFQYQAGG